MSDVDMRVVKELENKAVDIRKMLIDYVQNVGVAHLGGPMSATDMAVALYYHYMNWDPKDYKAKDRDRFILSKGHNADLFYNIFCDMGLFTREEIFSEYNKLHGRFGQHPNRMYLPMFEVSAGSLGHGLSLATGYALGARASGDNYRVFCMTGDGELDEGSNWEALMLAAHRKLGNLVLIVDKNQIMGTGPTEEVMALGNLTDKLTSFGWDVINIKDGNDMLQVCETLENLPEPDCHAKRKPIAIISNTIKGAGVDFMTGTPSWHLGSVDDELGVKAYASIEAFRKYTKE
ncbi:MAG: transketolase [Lachnospiraceae bacterium]|nr:transketolase [Lachnospiraceae bacterium]